MTTTEDESEFTPERTRSHRDLIVWRKGIDLAAEAHRLAVILPVDEGDALRHRMVQSAIAIPTNIAKGYGLSTKAFIKYLDIARGKLYATKAMLELGEQLGFFDARMLSKVRLLADEVDRMLCLLMDSLGTRKWE